MNIFESWICKMPIAKKGLHDEQNPENSLGAFKKAIEKGYAIELDVRALADQTIVVFHDQVLGRMTGADGYITNYTYDDVKSLSLNKTEFSIPTLKEALDFINGQVPVIIDIKNEGKVGFEKDVLKLINAYKGEVAIMSFNPYSVEWFKINAPHVKRGICSSFFKESDPGIQEKLNFIRRFALKRMLFNKKIAEPNFIVYQLKNLPNRYVKKYSDLPVIAYNVKNKEDFLRAVKYANNAMFENFIPENK